MAMKRFRRVCQLPTRYSVHQEEEIDNATPVLSIKGC